MLSFHGKQEIKDKYIARVRAHREADRLIQGTGWDNGKGCAVGCTLENYNHSRYPIELGLPEWLARLEDVIFEGLPNQEAMTWPERFLNAVPVGVDVEIVRHQLAIRRLDRLLKLQTDLLEKNPDLKEIISQVLSALDQVKKCHEAEMNKNYCDWSAALLGAESAWSAALLGAESAWSAARSVLSAAESALLAAESAWSGRGSALLAALSAAESAARSALLGAESAWSAARSALLAAESALLVAESARSATRSALLAAELAARSAARSALLAAESVARSTLLAAESALLVAESVARSAAWQQEANDLLELLAECK